MPRIPYAPSQELPPAESGLLRVPTELAAAPWLAQAKTGSVIGEVGTKALALSQAYEAAKRDAQTAVDTTNVKTQMLRDNIAIGDDFTKRSDFGNFNEEYAKKANENLNRYATMITDETARARLMPTLEVSSMEYGMKINHLVDARQKQFNVSLWEDSIPVYRDLFARTGDTQFIQQFKDSTESMVRTGTLTGIQGAHGIDQVALLGDLSRAERRINSDPNMWIGMYVDNKDREGAFNAFKQEHPYLDINKFDTLNAHASGISKSMKLTLDSAVKESQRINMNTAADVVLSSYFDMGNGKRVILSHEQKNQMLEEIYKQTIPGTNERMINHEDYKTLKSALGELKGLKPESAKKDKTALVPFTHQTDGDTIYVNKYDADEVFNVQGEGYRPGSIVRTPKKDKVQQLLDALNPANAGAIQLPKGSPGGSTNKPLGAYWK